MIAETLRAAQRVGNVSYLPNTLELPERPDATPAAGRLHPRA
jgi:hypothetical protein